MIKTFRETLTSLQDKQYGREIINKPLKSVIWYWTRYLLLVSVIPLVFGIVFITRYVPELPKFARDLLPEGTIGARGNQLVSTIEQPLRLGDRRFGFVMNLDGQTTDLNEYESGVLILKDRIVTKMSDGTVNAEDIGTLPDFSTDREQIAGWLSENRNRVWMVGLLGLILFTAFTASVTWSWRMLIFMLWTLAFWVAAKYILKRDLTLVQGFKLVVYASVIPLLISALTFLIPNSFLEFVGTAVFLYFGLTWLWNLPVRPQVINVPDVHSEPLELNRPQPSTSKHKATSSRKKK